jgi:hypothetical protein
MQRIQREAISEVSLTRSPSRFVGVLRLPRLRNTRFHGGGLPDDRTWREGVLSLKHRRSNETNQYHSSQQSPNENDWLPGNENVHRRPPGTKSGSRLPILYCEKPRLFGDILPELLRSRDASAKNSNSRKDELRRTHRTVFVECPENLSLTRVSDASHLNFF